MVLTARILIPGWRLLVMMRRVLGVMRRVLRWVRGVMLLRRPACISRTTVLPGGRRRLIPTKLARRRRRGLL